MDHYVYKLFSKDEAVKTVESIKSMTWKPGLTTNPDMERTVKCNKELNMNSPAASLLLGIHEKLRTHPQIRRDTLCSNVYPPRFNCYTEGEFYGLHADAPFMEVTMGETTEKIRTDYACTLFLTDDYEGGELIADGFRFKGKAGMCIVYPADSLHEVTPVTKGERICVITWIQSQIKDPTHRAILRDIASTLLGLEKFTPEHRTLSGVYARLTRMWS